MGYREENLEKMKSLPIANKDGQYGLHFDWWSDGKFALSQSFEICSLLLKRGRSSLGNVNLAG
jgi:hypothetical protein